MAEKNFKRPQKFLDTSYVSRGAVRVLVMLFLLIGFRHPRINAFQVSQDFQVCAQDSDCIAIPDACCSCNNGGRNRAINKKFLERYQASQSFPCRDRMCFATMSDDVSCVAPPVCRQQKCTLETKDASACDKRSDDYYDPNRCYYIYALTNHDLADCDKMTRHVGNDVTKEQCVSILGSRLHDISACHRLGSGAMVQHCEDAFYLGLAGREKNVEQCEHIVSADMKDSCYFDQAFGEKNVEHCYRIASAGVKDACLMDRASDANDVQLCQQIINVTRKASCVGEYYTKAASAASAQKDPALCEKFITLAGGESGEQYRNQCLTEIGVLTGDRTVCKSISNATSRNACERKIAIASFDSTYCLSIDDDDCLWKTTVGVPPMKQDEVCRRVMGGFNHQQCLEHYIAVCRHFKKSNDFEFDHSKPDYSRDACIEEVSANFLDDTYCATIESNASSSGRDQCVERVKDVKTLKLERPDLFH